MLKNEPTLILPLGGPTKEDTKKNVNSFTAFLGAGKTKYKEMIAKTRHKVDEAIMVPYLSSDLAHLRNYLFAANQKEGFYIDRNRLVFRISTEIGGTLLIGSLTDLYPEEAIQSAVYMYDVENQQFYGVKTLAE